MLQRVEIRKFRSCENVVLDDLGPITVLVGRNAVGKSNILRAIERIALSATSESISNAASAFDDLDIQVVAANIVFSYSFQTTSSTEMRLGVMAKLRVVESLSYDEGNSRDRKIFVREGDEATLWPTKEQPLKIRISEDIPASTAILSLLPADSPILQRVNQFVRTLKRVRYYGNVARQESGDNDAIGEMLLQDRYDEWLSRYERDSDPGSSVPYRLLHMKLAMPDRFDELRNLLGRNSLGVLDDIQIESIPFNTLQKSSTYLHWIRYLPASHSQETSLFSFTDLSEGTQRIITILLSLLFDQSSVMLLEHPEDGIHRGLLRKLIDILRTYSDQTQVILASHSSVVFNALEPEAIRLVTMVDGRTEVRGLSPHETSVVGNYLERDGSLADFIETIEEE